MQLDLQEETAVNHLYTSILKLDPDADEIDAKILSRVTQRTKKLYDQAQVKRSGGAKNNRRSPIRPGDLSA